MTIRTEAIQSAINEAERIINPKFGRGHRVEIHQHELSVLVAATNECIANGRWSMNKPQCAGVYGFREEGDAGVECIKITKNKQGILIADTEHLGKLHLNDFHDGMTRPMWRPIT